MNCKGCLTTSAALLLIILLGCVVGALTVGRFLASTDALSPADTIVVLSGDNEEFVRTQEAAHLFRRGYAPTVVFSSASSISADLTCSPARQLLGIARSQGLPSDVTIIISGAHSTYDEAVKLRRLTQQHKWHSLIVVTGLFHTRRAGRTFRALLPDTTIHVTAAPNPDYNAGRWWQTEDGLVSVFNEVIKLAFYWAKYGIAPF